MDDLEIEQKFNDLPYEFRVHSTTRGWSMPQAIEYYSSAKPFREYLERTVLSYLNHQLKKKLTLTEEQQKLLVLVRGSEAKLV